MYSAQATVLQAQRSVDSAQKALAATTLTAPVDGTVTVVNGTVGDKIIGFEHRFELDRLIERRGIGSTGGRTGGAIEPRRARASLELDRVEQLGASSRSSIRPPTR